MNQHSNYVGQKSFTGSYCADTHTHTTVCSTWSTGVVSNQPPFLGLRNVLVTTSADESNTWCPDQY